MDRSTRRRRICSQSSGQLFDRLGYPLNRSSDLEEEAPLRHDLYTEPLERQIGVANGFSIKTFAGLEAVAQLKGKNE